MNTFKSISLTVLAIPVLTWAIAAQATLINAEVPLIYEGEQSFDTVAFALRLPNSDLTWDDPAFYDIGMDCDFCDGLIFADHGWSLLDTINPLVAGVGGPAILNGETWGFFAMSFFADPDLYPEFEVEVIAFDANLNAMNPQVVTLTYSAANQNYVFSDIASSDWSPSYYSVFAVPEAGTLVLIGIGLAGLGMARWRQFIHTNE